MTILIITLTLLSAALLFLAVHHGPTGLMRAAGLWLVESADNTERRWQKIRAEHQKVLLRLAGSAE